ncbi:unnamed protein product [Mytilus coruscus]|uniref:Myb/SANT-like DNA-binding domain-containing protein n=1 Tax=Mytilus coruscus TaxID=42192 RepID=A0A6J8DW33_MYTCO|nr:unnamed protein product [Mytilus coruscus]
MTKGGAPNGTKKTRKANLNKDELETMLTALQQHKMLLLGKFSDSVTNGRKKLFGRQSLVNTNSGMRTARDVQKKYQDVLSSVKERSVEKTSITSNEIVNIENEKLSLERENMKGESDRLAIDKERLKVEKGSLKTKNKIDELIESLISKNSSNSCRKLQEVETIYESDDRNYQIYFFPR